MLVANDHISHLRYSCQSRRALRNWWIFYHRVFLEELCATQAIQQNTLQGPRSSADRARRFYLQGRGFKSLRGLHLNKAHKAKRNMSLIGILTFTSIGTLLFSALIVWEWLSKYASDLDKAISINWFPNLKERQRYMLTASEKLNIQK